MFELILAAHLEWASNADRRPAPASITTTAATYKPVTPECFYREAQRQRVEPLKLLSVMKTEGGRVGQFVRNSNGTYDMGPMQINTIHLPALATKFGVDKATVAQNIAYDGCFNVAVAAWMLRQRTDEVGGDFWMGIGRYHSKTPKHRNRYILAVHRHMTQIANQVNNAHRGVEISAVSRGG